MTGAQGPAEGDAGSDRDLLAEQIARVAGGDEIALAVVYRLTSGKLNALILRMMRDEAIAQDVLQEVYLTVWRRSATFDPALASPMTWLITIARNKAIDRLRSQRRQMTAPMPADGPDLRDPAPSIVEEMERREDRALLHACIERLDRRQQAAIRAAFFEGLTYEELALREETPLGTIKSRIRRGLQRLRACLDG